MMLKAKIGIGFVRHRFHYPDFVNFGQIRERGFPLLDLVEHTFRVKVHVLTFKQKNVLVGLCVYELRDFLS